MNHRLIAVILGLFLPGSVLAQNTLPERDQQLSRAIFKELIEINTAPSGNAMSQANRAMAQRLRDAGFPTSDVVLAGPNEQHQNLVARLRGRDATAKPIILMAHIDVVEALRSDWSVDPFTFVERDGWFYGRGTVDNKAGAATLIANMVRWKRDGFTPERDVIVILTTDEETTAENGITWLVQNRPELRNAEYALNTDAGEVELRDGTTAAFYVQSAEKVYLTFQLEARNRGGHSSLPRKDNAIYALASALTRLSAFRFPIQLSEITRTSLTRQAALEQGQLAADLRAVGGGKTTGPEAERLAEIPHLNANLRTTCVATMLGGGHAENALPQTATATVNCRVMPGADLREVQRTLERVVADTSIVVRDTRAPVPSPPSPLRPDLFTTLESLAKRFWPGATVIPQMSNGATDGLYLRNIGVPVYGVSAILADPNDDRAHGRDERIGVKAFYDAVEFWNQMVRRVAGRAVEAS